MLFGKFCKLREVWKTGHPSRVVNCLYLWPEVKIEQFCGKEGVGDILGSRWLTSAKISTGIKQELLFKLCMPNC